MKKLIAALLLFPAMSGAQTYYSRSTVPPLPPATPVLYATSYGSCIWNSTHDVGPCMNSAIAAAAAAGGGTVMIPCGTLGLSTQIENHTAGVKLKGCGIGATRDTFAPSSLIAATKFIWIGGSTANPALLVQTPAGGTTTITAADVTGLGVDCANLCGEAIQINGVTNSTFQFSGAEATLNNIHFTTPTDLEASGNQGNDIWAYSRSTSGSNSPTGILFDAGCAACFNTSYNVMHILAAWYNKGDGIVFGDTDNNTVEVIRNTPNSGATGSPVVCANSLYVMPNGQAVKNNCRQLRIFHDGSRGVRVTGFQTNSTFTAGGGNAGSAALNPLVLVTSAGSAALTSTLTFASTTGATPGETISCGGPVNGVFNGTPILAVTSTTLTIDPSQFIAAVPISTSCTLTYGIAQAAVTGTYTLTATSSTQYTLTAPGGGHTQSGITASGGFLTFTDMIIPWTGTPTTNDSWTIVVPNPAVDVATEYVDKGNSLPNPTWELGTTGYYSLSTRVYPVSWQQQCVIGNNTNIGGKSGTAPGANACSLGGNAGVASGTSSATVGGEANTASGEASIALGGTGLAVSGFGAAATGQNHAISGADSFASGSGVTDRGRFASSCIGSATFSVTGDAQTCYEILRGTGASTSAIRLTNNAGAAGGNNCFNLPNNGAYALTIDIMAFDHTTVTKSASWNNLTALATRGANAAATAISIVTASPVPTYSNGTLTGNALSITADTGNGCLNISWTPPTGNTDTWNVAARVRSVEVQ